MSGARGGNLPRGEAHASCRVEGWCAHPSTRRPQRQYNDPSTSHFLTPAHLLPSRPGTYVNLPPFPLSCVGEGNLVGVPGKTTVPDSYDYNGLGAPPSPSPATPAAPAPEPEAPVEAPVAEPVETPVPAPAPAPVVEEEEAPPTPAPVPTAATPSAATAKSVGSLLCAVLALLAGAALL